MIYFKREGFRLRKAQRILFQAYKCYKKKAVYLNPADFQWFEVALARLDESVKQKQSAEAHLLAKEVEQFCKERFKKTLWEHGRELTFAIIFALVVASVVRQMWFEHYEVPTGSMRPTLLELDHLLVSKDAFGLNVPFQPDHFYFDPELVQRNSIIVFTGEGMDISDVDTRYFMLFPGKKRYIKRLIAKPGDTVYFYGGKVYGVDAEGNDLIELRNNPWTCDLEYLPFLNFEGVVNAAAPPFQAIFPSVILKQMNIPIAKLNAIHQKTLRGASLYKEDLPYSDIWGMGNFGMCRLLTADDVRKYSKAELQGIEQAPLYLEIRHHPDLTNLCWGIDPEGRTRPMFNLNVSLIPIEEAKFQQLMQSMYTTRFFVQNGKGARYHMNQPTFASLAPAFPGVPDGCYEFYHGEAWEIGWGGVRSLLPKTHPLYEVSMENLLTLFNLGIQMNGAYAPHHREQTIFPSRYVYFRDGDLYVMGAPLFHKGEAILEDFVAREEKKEQEALRRLPYQAFKDSGPPLRADGGLDIQKVAHYGLTLPERSYLAMGDNHAVSVDCRVFGFIPEENLQGGPSLVVWPPGSNWGALNQMPYPWFTLPRCIIWAVVILIAVGYFWWQRNRYDKWCARVRREK